MIIYHEIEPPFIETVVHTSCHTCRNIFELDALVARARKTGIKGDEQFLDLLLDEFIAKFVASTMLSIKNVVKDPTVESMGFMSVKITSLFIAECHLVDLIAGSDLLDAANNKLYMKNSDMQAFFQCMGVCTDQFEEILKLSRAVIMHSSPEESHYGEMLLQAVQFLEFADLVREGGDS